MKINKKSKNNMKMFNILVILLFIIIFSTAISAQTAQVSSCCQKTLSGAYCQNAPPEQCDSKFISTPTSCEATSFCKKGCCYDSNEGICMENTPQEACKASNGVWTENPTCQTPQCELGCCVLGQQAAYVPLVRCKKLAALYGLQVDFRKDVKDELSCINLAQAQDTGACVYEADFVTTCKFETRGECIAGKLNSITNSTSIRFYKDYLCTNKEFNTDCQPLDKTTCVDGKDGVYFLDSCGNIANIYDSSKIWSLTKSSGETIDYWAKVKKKDESCGAGSQNANSKNCGNCDYLSGSTCSKAKTSKPSYGDYICSDLNCYDTSNGKDYKNGESWCYYDDKTPITESVGSRYFRHVCIMGEEMVEPCDDYRKQVCVEEPIASAGGSFSQAGCVVNRWQDCILINKSDDCLNTDKRDCEWISTDPKDLSGSLAGLTGQATKSSSSLWSSLGLTGGSLKSVSTKNEIGRCVPQVSPGLMFWDTSAGEQCKIGNQQCIVKYTKGLLDSKWTCKEHCECLTPEFEYKYNQICTSLGDCGAQKNYLGKFTDKGYEVTVSKGKETKNTNVGGADKTNGGTATTSGQTFSGSGNTTTFAGSTGNVIQGLVVGTYNRVVGGIKNE
ncbi:MAG: hypothetical protein WC781_04260 [Candidatus Pacearchaeota archaeon]|jgi:hypothetical protein